MTSEALKGLRDCFLGEYVVFYLRDMSIPAMTAEGGDMVKISGMVDGLVLDIDANFYYIGDDNGDVNRVISHSVIGIVEIAEPEESMSEMIEMIRGEDEGLH